MTDDRLDGINMPLGEWLTLNREPTDHALALALIAPFPPPELMQIVSGLTERGHFAQHGVTIFEALQNASPKSLREFSDILDFGCGCGRLARIFKGYNGKLTGCDVDAQAIEWINQHLSYMNGVRTTPNGPLPFASGQFDCVISISVFSHLNEDSQFYYLSELARCTKPGAILLLTVHGERALERALQEEQILRMLDIPPSSLRFAKAQMERGSHSFVVQEQGHLTTAEYKYGISFIPDAYIGSKWSQYFQIEKIVHGAIHDFQSIVVCRRG